MNINELIDFTASGRVNAVAIVAVDKHWGIGIDDKLPDFPRLDLHWFKHCFNYWNNYRLYIYELCQCFRLKARNTRKAFF